MQDVRLSKEVFHLKVLLRVDFDSVVFGWTSKPEILGSHLEYVTCVVASDENWIGELVRNVLVGMVSTGTVLPYLVVKKWV